MDVVAAEAYSDRRGQPEPAVRGVLEGPRMDGGIHRLCRIGFMDQCETAADHRIAHFADRHGARHRCRPAQPQQPVGTVEFVDGGAAFDPVDVAPQRQGLGVSEQSVDTPTHHQPFADRASVGLHRGGGRRRSDHGTFGQQMPGPLARLWMRRILLVDREFVADPPVGDQFAAVADQRIHASPTSGIDANPVVPVGDLQRRRPAPSPGPTPRARSGRPAMPSDGTSRASQLRV